MTLEPSRLVDNSQGPVTVRLDMCGLEFRSWKREMLYLKCGWDVLLARGKKEKKKILLAPKGTFVKRGDWSRPSGYWEDGLKCVCW